MDWLNRARQFIGNLVGDAGRTIGNIAGGVARNVSQAEQQAARVAQQATRNIQQQVPRIQLPPVQIPRVQVPQAPRVDFGAVTKALNEMQRGAGGFLEGADMSMRMFAGKQFTPKQQTLIKSNPKLQSQVNKQLSDINKYKSVVNVGTQIGIPAYALYKNRSTVDKALKTISPTYNIATTKLPNTAEAFKRNIIQTTKLATGQKVTPEEVAAMNELYAKGILPSLQVGKNASFKDFVTDVLKTGVPVGTELGSLMTGTKLAGLSAGQKAVQLGKAGVLGGTAMTGQDIITGQGSIQEKLKRAPETFATNAALSAGGELVGYAGGKLLGKLGKVLFGDLKGAEKTAATIAAQKALSQAQKSMPNLPIAKAGQTIPTPRTIAENVYPTRPGIPGRVKPPAGSVVDATPGLAQRAQTQFVKSKKVPGEVATAVLNSKFLLSDPRNGNIQKYILDAKGNPVGGIVGFYEGPNRAILKNIYVLPGQRGKGAASKLIKAFEDEARINGISEIKLASKADKLYKKLGYQIDTTRTPGPGANYFTKTIQPPKSELPVRPQQAINNIPQIPQKPIFETVPESAMRPKAPKGGKERGFITTVKESPQTEGATLTILKQTDGSYKIKSNKVLEKQANERIASNVADAKTYAITQSDDQAVATAGQLIKYYQAKGDYGQAAEVASQAARTLTEAGRTIQAASLYNKLNPEGILQYASNKMQKVGRKLDPESAEILTNMAKKIEAMPDGESKQIAIKELLDEVGRTQGSALPDKIITLWKAGLLTSPITTAGNLTSNTIKQVVKKTADDPIAAIVDMTLSLATGKRTKTFTLKGLGEGGAEGFKRGAKYFKTGYDPRDPISKLDQKDVYFSKGFFGKAAQGYTDTVFRSLGAQDQPYFYAALKNTLYDEAIAAAKNKGVKGAAREKFIKDFINNTDTKVLDKATEEARTAVFQNKTFLGDMASKLTQSNNPATRTVAQFIMPFSRVPSAVATEIFERTPLGAAKEIVKQIAKKQYDQRALATAISKSTTGTIGLMGLGYALDRGGNINLAMPTSQAEQNLWQQEGRQPFSVKIGDKYYSMNYIQPFGSLIAMGAQYNRTLREGGSQQDALAASFAMGAKAVTEQSFLRGVSGALGALQDPGRYAERFVEQTAGSVVPNIVRTTARAFDPLQREVGSAGEAIVAGIPGLREKLQPKVDIFGQPIARTASPIDTLFNPLRPTTAQSTPETNEIRRLFDKDKNVIPSEIDKNAFGKENPINQQQINDLKTAMGNAVLNRYQQIMSDPRYANLSDDQKAKALKDAKDAIIQGEKFKFANANGLPYTTADKLDKDTADYINGVVKDNIAATLPKPPKVKVSKASRGRKGRTGRRGGRGRVAKVNLKSIKTPRITVKGLPSVPSVKTKKLSFKAPKPKATARKSIKIKTG